MDNKDCKELSREGGRKKRETKEENVVIFFLYKDRKSNLEKIEGLKLKIIEDLCGEE